MSTYEISKSSLLSLKAEIFRKQEELKKKSYENVRKRVPLVIKNKGVEARNERDTIEDLDLLEKSRIALEKKAKLYEKLSKSKLIDDDPASIQNRFLVRFNDKDKNDEPLTDKNKDSDEEDLPHEYDDADNSDEEWVEYVDCLGRTRTCLKKDLQYFKSKDLDYKRDEPTEVTQVNHGNEAETNESEPVADEPQLLSDDMRRETMREQWEKEENELRNKNDIHYQDVLFNEARSHGVGYYGFSKDEEVRMQQQASLEQLRVETQQQQKKAQEVRALREKQLAARIKAAKMRKRARLGLPLEEEEEEDPEIGPPMPPSTEPPETKHEDALKERLLEEARRNHVRPWDVGKEKVNEFYEYTQEEWVDKQRKERNNEFAPPTAYGIGRNFRAEPAEFEISKSQGSLRFSTKKPDDQRKSENKRPVRHINPYKREDLEDPFNEETRTFNYNPAENITTKRKYKGFEEKNSKIKMNEDTVPVDLNTEINLEETSGNNSTKFEDTVSYGSTEGFQHSTHGYHDREEKELIYNEYNCSDAANKVVPENIEASIEAGLKFLRDRNEKKRSVRDHENDDMFAL